jgi:hypothetical protein
MDEWTNEEKQAYQSTTIDGKMSAKLYKRTGKDIKKKDAKKFLAYLDKNNDMLAEISEVVNFVLQGMKVDKKDRKKWKRRSSLHIILMEFIETVEHAIFENI